MMVSSSWIFVNVFTAGQSHARRAGEAPDLQAATGTALAKAAKYTSSGVA